MKFNRNEFLNVPNYISIGRVVAIPVFMIFLLMIREPQMVHQTWNEMMSFIAGLVYAVASISDLVDGFLARRAKLTGAAGKFLDPLADKLLNLAAVIMLIPLGRIPAWLVVLILFREITVTALRGIAANEQIVIAASKWGKYKNAFGSFGVGFLIWYYPFWGINWLIIGWITLIISLIFSFGSGVHYIYRFYIEVKRINLPTFR